jgi:hypothetical protein
MMYFFQLTEGDRITVDAEGIDLPSLEVAEAAALKAVGELVAEAVTRGERDYSGALTLEDDSGRAVLTLSFACPIQIGPPTALGVA